MSLEERITRMGAMGVKILIVVLIRKFKYVLRIT